MDAARSLSGRIRFALQLLLSYLKLTTGFFRAGACDVIIVGHPGYFHVHLARVLRAFKCDKPVLVYDVFIPLYNAVIEDREMFLSDSIVARLLRRFEASCCTQADVNLLDTITHCRYIEDEFNISADRLIATYVGSSLQAAPMETAVDESTFKIVFVGTYIPLQGVETILAAAELLLDHEDIEFLIVGCSQLINSEIGRQKKIILHNVKFVDWVATESLPTLLRQHHLALGIFGDTKKSARVIPTKIFDICKVGMPFITGDTPAVREVFVDGKNAVLIPCADPEQLAQAILRLKEDPERRHRLQEGVKEVQAKIFAAKNLCLPLLECLDQH